jgi:hypothetical protein
LLPLAWLLHAPDPRASPHSQFRAGLMTLYRSNRAAPGNENGPLPFRKGNQWGSNGTSTARAIGTFCDPRTEQRAGAQPLAQGRIARAGRPSCSLQMTGPPIRAASREAKQQKLNQNQHHPKGGDRIDRGKAVRRYSHALRVNPDPNFGNCTVGFSGYPHG